MQFVNDKFEGQKQTIEYLEQSLKTKDDDLKATDKDISELTKGHKNEILKLVEEIKRFREKWVPPEKFQELQKDSDEQDRQIKSLKDDVNRKRELINSLKNQIEQEKEKEKEKESLMKSKSGGTPIEELQEKIKNLNKDLGRKDLLIKDLKTNLDQLKVSDKKQSEEISNLTEKLKIAKIDIGRKETFIKDLKEKKDEKESMFNPSNKINEESEKLKEKIKKY